MKKFTTLCLSLLLSATAFAETEPGTFSLQPKVGLNVSSITDTDGDAEYKAGLALGVEANYRMSSLFSLSFGTLYSQQGTKGKMGEAKLTMMLDYINVPVLVNLHLAEGLALKTGLQAGFIVNDKARVDINGVSIEGDLEEALRNSPVRTNVELQKFDLSIPMGLSYEISNVVIDARYNLGLIDVFKNTPSSCKNSVFQFTVGYKFAL